MSIHWLLVYFYVFDVSFGLALLFTPLFRQLSFRWGVVDQPDAARKIHTGAMPLLGGVALFAAFAVNIVFSYLVILPLAGRVDLPFTEFPDVRAYIGGASTDAPVLFSIDDFRADRL